MNIPKINVEQIKNLTSEQLKAFTTDQYNKFTVQQKEAFNDNPNKFGGRRTKLKSNKKMKIYRGGALTAEDIETEFNKFNKMLVKEANNDVAAASISPSISQGSNVKILRQEPEVAMNQSQSNQRQALTDSGFDPKEMDLAKEISLREHFSSLTEKQTAALQKELIDIKELLQGRVASASNMGTGTDTGACTGNFDLSPQQLSTVLNDSYAQIIQYLKLMQKIVEKKPNQQLSDKINAALVALQINEADSDLSQAGIDINKIQQISNSKVSGIADILFSLLGIGIISSTLGGRKTRKRGKGKKRRQSLKRVHNKKYRIQLYSKGKSKR